MSRLKSRRVLQLMIVTLGVAVILSLSRSVSGDVNPYVPLEVVPFTPATGIQFVIAAAVRYDPQSGLFRYDYTLANLPGSQQPLGSFELVTEGRVQDELADQAMCATGWCHGGPGEQAGDGTAVILFCPHIPDQDIPPGQQSQAPLTFRSVDPPGIIMSYTRGDAGLPSGNQIVDPTAPSQKWPNDSVHRFTVGPVREGELSAAAQIDRMEALKHQAFENGWITNQGIVNSLDQKLQHARDHLAAGRKKQASNVLKAFQNELSAQRGKHVKEDAYQLLSANLELLNARVAQLP